MLRNGLLTFKFLNSQKASSFVQAGDFILAENIKLIDVIKENCLQKEKKTANWCY